MGYFESIYSDGNLPHGAKSVYMYLKDRANKDSQCWPGIKTIARELQMSVSTVKRALKVKSRVMRKIDSTSGRNLLQWGG